MKPQMTPRRSQPLFESLESRLLMDATLAIQPDGPMPQDAATDAEAAIEVNADATASEDGTIRLWEMFEGRQVKSWNAHGGGVLSLHYHHGGQLVSSGRDRHLKLWNADGKQMLDGMQCVAVFG